MNASATAHQPLQVRALGPRPREAIDRVDAASQQSAGHASGNVSMHQTLGRNQLAAFMFGAWRDASRSSPLGSPSGLHDRANGYNVQRIVLLRSA
jgi:hypothetical protein